MTALAPNILHFARLLRAAGMPLGPGQALAAAEAVALAGVADKPAMRQALFATLVTRRDQIALFDLAFDLFWRDPRLGDRAMAMLMPLLTPQTEASKASGARRLAEALAQGHSRVAPGETARVAPQRAQQGFSGGEPVGQGHPGIMPARPDASARPFFTPLPDTPS